MKEIHSVMCDLAGRLELEKHGVYKPYRRILNNQSNVFTGFFN